jgi:hypothetical protein
MASPENAARLRDAIDLLESIAADRKVLAGAPAEDRIRLLQAVARVYSPDRADRRRMAKAAARDRRAQRVKQAEETLAETGIRTLRQKPIYHSPNVFPPREFEQQDVESESTAYRATEEVQCCYVCKESYSHIHHFYDQMCPACAELNFNKRTELADLRGRVALLTGGRVKIGYQAGLKLLRSGADLIVTTRFPRDSASRYAREHDFGEWADRLEIFGLDLRHAPSVEAFCSTMLKTRHRLDFIVNNACQTVRRPPAFYAHMMEGDGGPEECPSTRKLLGSTSGPTFWSCSRSTVVTGAVAGRGARVTQATCFRQGYSTRTCNSSTCAPQFLAPPARRNLDRELLEVQAGQRNRAVHPQRAPEAADDPHARARQAHRQRLGDGGAVLSPVQDNAPSHTHGESRAQHDDARPPPTITRPASI